MALEIYQIVIVVLFLGGLTGWTLFGLSVLITNCSRRKELKMIEHISEELKKVRKELKELK